MADKPHTWGPTNHWENFTIFVITIKDAVDIGSSDLTKVTGTQLLYIKVRAWWYNSVDPPNDTELFFHCEFDPAFPWKVHLWAEYPGKNGIVSK